MKDDFITANFKLATGQIQPLKIPLSEVDKYFTGPEGKEKLNEDAVLAALKQRYPKIYQSHIDAEYSGYSQKYLGDDSGSIPAQLYRKYALAKDKQNFDFSTPTGKLSTVGQRAIRRKYEEALQGGLKAEASAKTAATKQIMTPNVLGQYPSEDSLSSKAGAGEMLRNVFFPQANRAMTSAVTGQNRSQALPLGLYPEGRLTPATGFVGTAKRAAGDLLTAEGMASTAGAIAAAPAAASLVAAYPMLGVLGGAASLAPAAMDIAQGDFGGAAANAILGGIPGGVVAKPIKSAKAVGSAAKSASSARNADIAWTEYKSLQSQINQIPVLQQNRSNPKYVRLVEESDRLYQQATAGFKSQKPNQGTGRLPTPIRQAMPRSPQDIRRDMDAAARAGDEDALLYFRNELEQNPSVRAQTEVSDMFDDVFAKTFKGTSGVDVKPDASDSRRRLEWQFNEIKDVYPWLTGAEAGVIARKNDLFRTANKTDQYVNALNEYKLMIDNLPARANALRAAGKTAEADRIDRDYQYLLHNYEQEISFSFGARASSQSSSASGAASNNNAADGGTGFGNGSGPSDSDLENQVRTAMDDFKRFESAGDDTRAGEAYSRLINLMVQVVKARKAAGDTAGAAVAFSALQQLERWARPQRRQKPAGGLGSVIRGLGGNM